MQNPFFCFRPVSDAEPLRVKEYDIEGYIISYSRWLTSPLRGYQERRVRGN